MNIIFRMRNNAERYEKGNMIFKKCTIVEFQKNKKNAYLNLLL